MQEKKNPNKITLILTDQELRLLDSIRLKEGQFNLSTVIHECIRFYYKKEYYTKHKEKSVKIIETQLTPEQICEKRKGWIVVENGRKFCREKKGPSLHWNTPIEMLKEEK